MNCARPESITHALSVVLLMRAGDCIDVVWSCGGPGSGDSPSSRVNAEACIFLQRFSLGCFLVFFLLGRVAGGFSGLSGAGLSHRRPATLSGRTYILHGLEAQHVKRLSHGHNVGSAAALLGSLIYYGPWPCYIFVKMSTCRSRAYD